MQRVFEIQSNWDERQKLRHFAISRPPITPSWPIGAPAYAPAYNEVYHKNGSSARFKQNKIDNNFSFSQNKNENLNSIKNQANFKNKDNKNITNNEIQNLHKKLISEKSILENEIEQTKKEIQQIKIKKELKINDQNKTSKKDKNTHENKINLRTNNIKTDHEKIAQQIYSHLKNNKTEDLNKIRKMLIGNNENEIKGLIKLVKNHPEVFTQNENKVNNTNKENIKYKENFYQAKDFKNKKIGTADKEGVKKLVSKISQNNILENKLIKPSLKNTNKSPLTITLEDLKKEIKSIQNGPIDLPLIKIK